MKVSSSALPPADKPLVQNHVPAGMDVPLCYMTEHGPIAWAHGIFCGKAFADTVLEQLNEVAKERNCGLVHVGFYNPRKARRKDDTPIVPARWSNHAYGKAVDFRGVVLDGDPEEFVSVAQMKTSMPGWLEEIKNRCAQAVVAINRRAEIVDEGDWLHIWLWPA